MRKGEAVGLRDLEGKALSVGSDPDGGYLVPDELGAHRQLAPCATSRRSAPSPACARCRARSTRSRSPSRARRPAGWPRPRRGPRPTHRRWPSCRSRPWSSTPCRRRPRRCSTTAPSTSTSGSPRKCESAFAEQEGTAFVTGNGTDKPKGFLDYTKVARGELELGQHRLHPDRRRRRVRRHRSGRQADRPRLHAQSRLPRRTRTFVMNRKTQSAIRKIKDGEGNYLWQPAGHGRRRLRP